MAFEGLGCDLDAANALLRAVCEAVQAHTDGPARRARSLRGREALAPSAAPLVRWPARARARRVDFGRRAAPPETWRRDWQIALERLRSAGLDAAASWSI